MELTFIRKPPQQKSQCSHVDRRKREATLRTSERIMTHRRKRHLQRKKRAAAAAAGDKPNSKILMNDKGRAPVNKLNSSEVIRLTVVITDKKKGKEGQNSQSIMVREVAAPSFQACTLSFEFWILVIGMTIIVVALTSTTVSCALKRRKLKDRKRRKNEKAVKLALSNMKRMQMSSLPWGAYGR